MSNRKMSKRHLAGLDGEARRRTAGRLERQAGPPASAPPLHRTAPPLPLREVPTPDELAASHRTACDRLGTKYRLLRCYTLGECTIILTREYGRYHISINHMRRMPTWGEIAQAWYRVVPDAERRHAALILPPISEYINVSEFCMQVSEITPPIAADPPEPGG